MVNLAHAIPLVPATPALLAPADRDRTSLHITVLITGALLWISTSPNAAPVDSYGIVTNEQIHLSKAKGDQPEEAWYGRLDSENSGYASVLEGFKTKVRAKRVTE